MDRQETSENWRTNLLLTGGVVLTLLVALLLAQLDALQISLPPTPQPVTQLGGLAETTAVFPTNTSLPAVTLARPTETAVPTPLPTTNGRQPAVILCGDVPPGWSVYEVRAGDTLLTLSALSGASIAEISQVNCLQNGLLVSGLRIYLPVRRPTPVPCGPPWGWAQYRVAPGDTMFALALRHGTTVYAIMQANCLSNSTLYAGRTIFLPPLRATATPIWPTLPPPTPIQTATAAPSPTIDPTATETAVFTPTSTPTLPITVTVTVTATPDLPPTPDETPSATPPVATETPAPPTAVPPTDTPTPPTNTPPPPDPTATPET